MTQLETSAKIVADSITETGRRLTSFEVVFHRFVLAEFNTHCVFDRNSASSRAIPVKRQMQAVKDNLAYPLSWPAEKPGMQGGEELEGDDLSYARAIWQLAADTAVSYVDGLTQNERMTPLHKSVANRLLEPFMWHRVCVTATAYDNFFALRRDKMAQPEIRRAAELMWAAYDSSKPEELNEGDWHLPYVDDETYVECAEKWTDLEEQLPKISSARVARTSYNNPDGVRDVESDIQLFERLSSAEPMHASPMGQVARVDPWNEVTWDVPLENGGTFQVTLPKVGKFVGYRQFRHDLEFEKGYQSFS